MLSQADGMLRSAFSRRVAAVPSPPSRGDRGFRRSPAESRTRGLYSNDVFPLPPRRRAAGELDCAPSLIRLPAASGCYTRSRKASEMAPAIAARAGRGIWPLFDARALAQLAALAKNRHRRVLVAVTPIRGQSGTTRGSGVRMESSPCLATRRSRKSRRKLPNQVRTGLTF